MWLTRMKEMMNTYSLGSFIYNNNIETMVQFTKKCRTTEAEGGKDLPIQKNYQGDVHYARFHFQNSWIYIQLQIPLE